MAAKYKKRKDGRYLIQVQIGIQDNGKPRYKNIYAHTIKELEEKAANYRQELEKGIVVDDEGLTVGKWALKWLETYKSGKSYNTQRIYRNAVEVHIIPALGNYRLKDLKTYHIQEMVNKESSKGITRTLEIVKNTLNQILEQAIQNEYIYKNPITAVEFPQKSKPLKRALTDEEVEYVKSAELPLKEKVFVMLLLYTGLRKGEALALSKSDIDLKKRTISINKTIIVKVNQSEIKNSPKTAAGNRVVPIVEPLLGVLTEYMATVDGLLIFPSARNTLMSDTAFRRFWDKIMNAINVAAGGSNGRLKIIAIANDITPHMFRHTYATMLYYAEVDIKTAQYLLGHASIEMTLGIYTHLDAQSTKSVSDKLNSFLNPKDQTEQKC